jgi:hypothetical protein
LGSSLFARHYSGSRGFFPFLRVLRCFSSPACLHVAYVFSYGYPRITTGRFPHSDIPGSKVGQHLPRAFRSRPRPSSALDAKASTVCPYSLDRKEHHVCRYGVFKVHAGDPRRTRKNRRHSRCTARSLKTQQRGDVGLDILLGRPGCPDGNRSPSRAGSLRSWNSGFPRKEVIQPQLPLRLPCYDFTPIIDPTFDGCLPCGLAHRLRVLPTFVV